MIIGTLTTGAAVVSTFNINYVPQFLYFIAATGLTSIKVTVEGDGTILDVDTAGIAGLSGIRRFGAVANSYYIPLTNGHVPAKVTEIQCVNSAAQTPILYGHSLKKGDAYLKTTRTLVLANSTFTFENFIHLAFASPVTADVFTCEFVDGHVQRYDFAELLGLYTLYSNETDSYCIDNVEFGITSLTLMPSTNRTCYMSRYYPIGQMQY
jgi:hypothetical protein